MVDAASNPLAATRFGPIERFTTIDSTNRWLLDQARTGAPTGLVAVADTQTAGRGRLDRSWSAPPGGSLLVSVLLRPQLPLDRWHLLTITAGIAAAEVVMRLTDGVVTPKLKWPNDLVLESGKLAGLLAERADDALVVGMGLNVDWPEVPTELASIATAISLAGAIDVPSRDAVLFAWLRRWHGWLEIVAAPDGPQRVHAANQRSSATIGSEVRVELHAESFVGTAIAIDEAGHLVLDTTNGRRTVSAGDVVHLRGA
jgi:BirA family biotin operon repressor/biotin-[acetyl-CoA-carboxylase] ligase